MDNTAQPFTVQPMSPRIRVVTLLNKTKLVIATAFISIIATRGLIDPDYFWHLKTGEYIVSNLALPAGDIFSHLRLGQEWNLHEWLFEVILYCVHSLGGELAVMAMAAMLGLLAVLTLGRCALRVTEDQAASFIAVAAGFASFGGSITARPQLITYCLLAYYLARLVEFKYVKKNVSLLWMPLAMVVWVNSHGGFLVGVAFLFAFTGCEWLRAWYSDAYAAAADRARLVRLTQVCALTLAATLVNPEFIWHWKYPIMVLGMKANAVIIEWQSPDFHANGPERAYLAMTVVFVLTYIYAARKRDITEIAIPGLFILNGFISLRHISLASLVIIPFLALALHDGVLAKVIRLWREGRLARAIERVPGAKRELGAHEFVLNWFILAAILIGFVAFRPAFEQKKQSALEAQYPVKAVDFILSEGIKGVMYNEYNHGGYLIYRLAPKIKVMIDGRADVYGDELIMDYGVISTGHLGWKEKFENMNIDFAVTNINSPIRQLLLHTATFREVYADKNFSVLLRGRSASAKPIK